MAVNVILPSYPSHAYWSRFLLPCRTKRIMLDSHNYWLVDFPSGDALVSHLYKVLSYAR